MEVIKYSDVEERVRILSFYIPTLITKQNLYIFRYQNMPLRPSKAVTIDSPDYFTKLAIRPVRRDDSGEYTVTAVNSSGKDTVTINVIVTDKPSKPEGPMQVLTST